jgi:tyrosinase
MNDPMSSPGDPMFYLHHTWLDKLWWNWQSLDLKRRLTDMSGNNVISPESVARFFPPVPSDWP